jgi:S1-C subfamily serine protease
LYCNGKSPAKDAGMMIGDRITEIRGCSASTKEGVISLIQDTAPNSAVILKVIRNELLQTVSIKTTVHTPTIYTFPSKDVTARTCNPS